MNDDYRNQCKHRGSNKMSRRTVKWIALGWMVLSVPLFYVFVVRGQKPEVKPAFYKLNERASTAWLEMEDAKHKLVSDCQGRFDTVQRQEAALAIGAGVPDEAMANWIKGADGLIVFSIAKPSPSP